MKCTFSGLLALALIVACIPSCSEKPSPQNSFEEFLSKSISCINSNDILEHQFMYLPLERKGYAAVMKLRLRPEAKYDALTNEFVEVSKVKDPALAKELATSSYLYGKSLVAGLTNLPNWFDPQGVVASNESHQQEVIFYENQGVAVDTIILLSKGQGLLFFVGTKTNVYLD